MKVFFRILRTIILVLQVFASTLLIISLIRTHILSLKLVSLIVLVLAVLFIVILVCFYLAFRSEKKNGEVKKSVVFARILTGFFSVLISFCLLFAFQYTRSLNSFFDKISESIENTSSKPAEKEFFEKPMIVYISGTDSRQSDVDDPDARSDVNIVVVVNPKKEKILLASIPRDTYVQLHGTEGMKDKLTHAGLTIYDENMSKSTIEDLLSINIKHTIKVSFDTVIKVVDELGGIEIFSDTPLTLKISNPSKVCNIIYGLQTVDGDCALRFSRERKSYYRGDKHRGENQMEVLTGIINKFSSSKEYVLKLPTILEIAGDSFRTTFSRDEITKLIQVQLEKQTKWQTESISVDGEGQYLPTYTYSEEMPLYVMIPDEESLEKVKNTIEEYLKE